MHFKATIVSLALSGALLLATKMANAQSLSPVLAWGDIDIDSQLVMHNRTNKHEKLFSYQLVVYVEDV